MASDAAASAVVGSPCGACKSLRRKCTPDCIFAPYFCPDQGPERFAAIHRVFGASNVAKLLLHVPVQDRGDTVVTVAYEAQARLRDPVYGCVAHIYALQRQVASLEGQLMQLRAQMAENMIQGQKTVENHFWTETNTTRSSTVSVFPSDFETCYMKSSCSVSPPQSSIDWTATLDEHTNYHKAVMELQAIMLQSDEDCLKMQITSAKYCQAERIELQELALKMMQD